MPSRIRLLLVFIYLGMAVLAGRLVQLQVFQHGKYATLAQGNHQRTETIPALRGRIFDRNGNTLADNRIAVDLYYSGGPVMFERQLLEILGLDELPQVEKGEEVVLAANLPDEWVPTLAELCAGQPNLRLEERIERYYPNPIAGPVISGPHGRRPEARLRTRRPGGPRRAGSRSGRHLARPPRPQAGGGQRSRGGSARTGANATGTR